MAAGGQQRAQEMAASVAHKAGAAAGGVGESLSQAAGRWASVKRGAKA